MGATCEKCGAYVGEIEGHVVDDASVKAIVYGEGSGYRIQPVWVLHRCRQSEPTAETNAPAADKDCG